MADENSKKRTRMVVEEVSEAKVPEEEKAEENQSIGEVKEEVKEKVEELQDITEHMGSDIEKSAGVQEELAEAADKIEPKPTEIPHEPGFSPKSRSFSPLIIIIPGVLLLGAVLGGIYFYQKSLKESSPSTNPTPFENLATSVPSASGSPSASPSAKLDLTKYPIDIQNGVGIPGTAASAKDLVTKAGFKVTATGNADNFNYTDTIIKTQSDVPQAFVDKLQTTLSGIYSVAKPQSLDSTSTYEVVVIIGSSKSQ